MKYGDFYEWVTNNLHTTLTKIINAKSQRQRPYYILVIVKKGYEGPMARNSNELITSEEIIKNVSERLIEHDFSGKIMFSTRIIILDNAPVVPMIGSSLWRIDNRIGEAKCLYILPPDKPVDSAVDMEETSEFIAKAKMPLYWNRN
jgi:hypothetical protein